jgi:hypothetical protein
MKEQGLSHFEQSEQELHTIMTLIALDRMWKRSSHIGPNPNATLYHERVITVFRCSASNEAATIEELGVAN